MGASHIDYDITSDRFYSLSVPPQQFIHKKNSKLDSMKVYSLNHVDSPYRTAISGAVLKLQEEGKLSTLKEKWWKGGMLCS